MSAAAAAEPDPVTTQSHVMEKAIRVSGSGSGLGIRQRREGGGPTGGGKKVGGKLMHPTN